MLKQLFARKPPEPLVDIHSHLLPGIDDGVKSFEESIDILERFQTLGYKKVITTPHISEQYPNTPEIIQEVYDKLAKRIKDYGLTIQMEFAAEYKLDGSFMDSMTGSQPLLTFSGNYLLFETSFHHKPINFDEIVFEMQSRGYIPVFAHPERYRYLDGDISWLKSLIERGVFLQMNLMSLSGVYGKPIEKMARKLLKEKMVSFVGSDMHRMAQWEYLETAVRQKLGNYGMLNKQLL